MGGIPDGVIAAMLYAAGKRMWTELNDPLANAIDKTIAHFSQVRGIEICRERFAALLEGEIGQEEIACFREGRAFIDGDKLALQFARYGDLYFENEDETLKTAQDILSYFKRVLTSELLRDPRSSVETLSQMQLILGKISEEDHAQILEAVEGVKRELRGEQKPEALADAERGYREVLEEELGTVKMLGSPDVPNVPVDLLDTFVSLDISSMSVGERRNGCGANEMREDSERELTAQSALKQAFKRHRLLLVLGDPGSGKTTLLKYYAMLCLKDQHERLGMETAILPMYLPLREVRTPQGELPPLHKCLAKWTSERYLNIDATIFYGWLKERPTLVLLDGLDEISDLDKRQEICEWIDKAATGLPNGRFVVTSRWTGYRKADGIELEFEHSRADVRDFSTEQQKEFLEKWFVAAYLREPPVKSTAEPMWRSRQTRKALDRANAIVQFLGEEENRGVRELASVPMLLQVIAILWRERENLPQGRAELYDAALKYLLDYRDRRRRIKPLMRASQALRVLCPVAFWMQDELHADEVQKSAMHDKMEGKLAAMKNRVPAEDFCENLRDRAGLVADYGADYYVFRHKSFREYLAGLELAMQSRRDAKCLDAIAGQFGDDWWNEPLRFFMGQVDDVLFDQFMSALFESDASGNMDQKSHDLLLAMVREAPERRIDSLVRCLNDEDLHGSRKRYIVDCLKTIGSDEALDAVAEFAKESTQTDARDLAQDVIAERRVEKGGGADGIFRVRPNVGVFRDLPQSFRNGFELNAEYIHIPAGRYKYQGKEEREVPDLYFAKYPVTNRRYRGFINYLVYDCVSVTEKSLPFDTFADALLRFAEAYEGFTEYLGADPSKWADKLRSNYDEEKRFKGDDQPVVGISWFDAQAYCLWLSALQTAFQGVSLEGSRCAYRLPKEVEWEWAAGGGERKFPWPDEKGEPTGKLANYRSNVGETTPVGRYPEGATPEGLMDMAGNVWEWMENLYGHKDYPEGRSLRGGSWGSDDVDLRCSARTCNHPEDRGYDVGFRVVFSQS